jgi:type IV secretion system protein VirB10
MSGNNDSPVDDGRSAVAGSSQPKLSKGAGFGILGLVGVIVLGYVWFNAFYSHRAKQAAAAPVDSGGGESFLPPPTAVKAVIPAVLPTPAPAPASPSFMGNQNQQTPATAPIMAFSGADIQIPPPAPAATTVPASATNGGGQTGPTLAPPGPDNSPLAARLKPTVMDGEQASVLQNPDMVITEGTMIPCVLQTAIDSTLPGLVTCVVPIDIRGSTGDVVLFDRGTKIVGQIQTGLLQGQNRVFVDWTRAETPDHVIVTLDSPGSDELGRAGLPGAVDNHFWERFGGALMLTLVQGGLDAATIEAAGQGSSNSTSQQAGLGFVYAAQSNGQSVANTALENTINIAPTLSKNQGDTVSLIVAHDLDFSNVYQLQVSGTGGGDGG